MLEEELVELLVVDELGRAYVRGQGRAGCRNRWGKLVLRVREREGSAFLRGRGPWADLSDGPGRAMGEGRGWMMGQKGSRLNDCNMKGERENGMS